MSTIVIRIIGDSLPEPTETFTLRVVSPPSAAREATGTIVDNDVAAGPCRRAEHRHDDLAHRTDRLIVTVKAGLGTLKKITFASAAEPMLNAQVETIGPASVIQGFGVYTPQPNVTQQSFVVRRSSPTAVMVELVVEDNCGAWNTLIGNGSKPW